MSNFDPLDWYWKHDDGRVYSSRRRVIVGDEDADFQAFRATRGFVTRWPVDADGTQTDAALAEVLAAYRLPFGPPSLDQEKNVLKAQIDAAAEAERLKYVTPGAGQAMTYQRKVDEARRAAAEENPKAADYPFLAASLEIDGESIAAVAQTVLSMDTLWAMIGSAIEAERLRAKAAIGAAKSVAEAQSAFAAIIWPSV